ncbi:hypothetical protein WG906_19290 [Pedobacter sp. P351]|uniref:DUF6929 family protein n=1 Tax=Pedobacter superstes TaxID=3133441 RepID=UPI0030AD5B88
MPKNLIYLIIVTGTLCCCKPFNSNTTKKAQLSYISSSELVAYPSGSTISFYGGNIYLMGDDSRTLLVLDPSLNITDTITLFPGSNTRIKKIDKADIESSEWIGNKLYLFGSGSLSSQRDSGFVFNPETRQIERIELGSFYQKIRESGIPELNLEGAALVKDHLLFVNRSNLRHKNNHLILSPVKNLLHAPSHTITLTLPGKAGVSGIVYLQEMDLLLLTASEEETSSAYGDGVIGESYLGLIPDISAKLALAEIAPDQWIPLGGIHNDFLGQKIESVCALSTAENKLKLFLVADNDNGTTRIFNLALQL